MTAPTTTTTNEISGDRPAFCALAAAVAALAALLERFGHLPGTHVHLSDLVPGQVEIRLHPSRTYGPDTLSGFEAWREALGIDPGAVTQDAVGGTGWLEAHTEWRGVLLRLTAFYDVPWGGERS